MSQPTVGEIRTKTIAFLRARGVDSPDLNADLLLAHVLEVPRIQVYLRFEQPLTDAELTAVRALVARRGKREPLAWITGERGFYDFDRLLVHPGVLDPRPDTETLVEEALRRLPPVGDTPVFVADVGCGTGAVGLAIAKARPDVRLYAIDQSEQAVQNTRENVALHELGDRVGVLHGDLLSAIPAHRPVDWVVSNPPYIPHDDLDALMPEVAKWEPRLALDGGHDGLDVVRRLVAQTLERARAGLVLEIGAGQAQATRALLVDAGLVDVAVRRDLGRIERVVSCLIAGDPAPVAPAPST